jgi:uncharacterized protein (TIGR00369 family)
MALEVVPVDEGLRMRFPAWPALCHPDGGVRTGIVVTAADVVGGMMAARSAHPDWIATSGLNLDQRRPACGGMVQVDCRVLRVGRTAVVLDHEVRDDKGEVGHGTMMFSRLVRRDHNPTMAEAAAGPVRFATDGPVSDEPIADQVGVRNIEPGAVELDLTDVVRNSMGTVQGGMLALVSELAAESATAAQVGARARVLDLSLDYVHTAKVGPVRAVAEVVRLDGRTARLRVEVHDAGAERLSVIAHATAAAV